MAFVILEKESTPHWMWRVLRDGGAKAVGEVIREGKDYEEIKKLDILARDLIKQYNAILHAVGAELTHAEFTNETTPEKAKAMIEKMQYPTIALAIYEDKEHDKMIWDLIEPSELNTVPGE